MPNAPAGHERILEINIPIEELSRRGELYGAADRNLRLIRTAFNVQITARDGTIRVGGADDDVRRAGEALERLQRSLRGEVSLTESVVQDAIQQALGSRLTVKADAVNVYLGSANIVPKGDGQRDYIEAIIRNDLTFCIGPAGTGKTYLAVAVSVSLLKQQRIKRIVLVRPAVEAGEKLGYLPGDIQAKVNPYLRPLFDAMNDMMGYDQLKRFIQNDVIEVMPLAFMRGRTLNHSAVILDEAQNATAAQMLMFLTRLGNHSKMIVTGDDSQSDLSSGAPSGLLDAMRRLDGEAGVGAVRLTPGDIVRHPLVQRVVDAYAQDEPRV